MRDSPASSPAVVVGIDGSRTAIDAALWAVDEAVSRDIPLRLVYAIDPDHTSGKEPQDAARDRAAAEVAIRFAYDARAIKTFVLFRLFSNCRRYAGDLRSLRPTLGGQNASE